VVVILSVAVGWGWGRSSRKMSDGLTGEEGSGGAVSH
jgi:hypothetical protein